MRREELYHALRCAAEVSGHTEFVVIGSQATHGTIQNATIDAVVRSPDVDLYLKESHGPAIWEALMRELGQDSEFHIETGTYIEVVSETLARFPDGWEARAKRICIGETVVHQNRVPVVAYFPEIHDLAVAKLAVHREKDVEFVTDLVMLDAVERETLIERFTRVPRTDQAIIANGLNDIEKAFARR